LHYVQFLRASSIEHHPNTQNFRPTSLAKTAIYLASQSPVDKRAEAKVEGNS